MAILNVPTEACKGVDVGGRRYDADGSGRIRVDDPAHARLLRSAAECFPTSSTPHAAGRVCTACGFRTWFVLCSRCGGHAMKEGHDGSEAPGPPG